jgi:NAD(P)-dependent dehydrogenase (short-subunit alcohol dehydrogenase family)
MGEVRLENGKRAIGSPKRPPMPLPPRSGGGHRGPAPFSLPHTAQIATLKLGTGVHLRNRSLELRWLDEEARMFQLDGAKVVIIGGSAGMGLATARVAMEHGAAMAIAARTPSRLDAAAKDLEMRFGRTVPRRALHVEDRVAVRAFLEAEAPFDHLVLPGSTVNPTLYDDLTDGDARASFDSKFWGPFWAAFDARDLMRRGGSVVFFSGVAAERPVRGYVIGACINGALHAGVRSLALELGKLGLRCNVISPSLVDTPLLDALHALEKEKITAALAARLPVGRIGRAEECAMAAMLLMCNHFMTGQVIGVDGGHLSIP